MSLKESSCDSSSLLPAIATSSAELISQDTKFCRITEIKKPQPRCVHHSFQMLNWRAGVPGAGESVRFPFYLCFSIRELLGCSPAPVTWRLFSEEGNFAVQPGNRLAALCCPGWNCPAPHNDAITSSAQLIPHPAERHVPLADRSMSLSHHLWILWITSSVLTASSEVCQSGQTASSTKTILHLF